MNNNYKVQTVRIDLQQLGSLKIEFLQNGGKCYI